MGGMHVDIKFDDFKPSVFFDGLFQRQEDDVPPAWAMRLHDAEKDHPCQKPFKFWYRPKDEVRAQYLCVVAFGDESSTTYELIVRENHLIHCRYFTPGVWFHHNVVKGFHGSIVIGDKLDVPPSNPHSKENADPTLGWSIKSSKLRAW